MKRIAIAFCLLWVFLVLPVHAQEYDYVAGAGGAAATGCPDASYLVCEDYTGSSDCDGTHSYGNIAWTKVGTGTAACDTASLYGAGYALTTTSTTNAARMVNTSAFAAQSTLYGYFKFKTPATVGAGTIMNFSNTGGTAIYHGIVIDATRAINNSDGSTTGTVSTDLMAANTEYYIWTKYVKGTGANSIHWACFTSDETQPTVNNDCSSLPSNCSCRANGTAQQDLTEITLGSTGSGTNRVWIYDKVRVKTSAIGSNPN